VLGLCTPPRLVFQPPFSCCTPQSVTACGHKNVKLYLPNPNNIFEWNLIHLQTRALFSLLGRGELYLPILIIKYLLHLHRSQMILSLRQCAIMVEQIPLPLMLHNRMMRRPTQNRLQNPPLIREWTKWTVSSSVAQEMRISC